MKNRRAPYLVRLIVVAYLIYLGVNMIRDIQSGTEDVENPALFIFFSILFFIIAGVLCVMSIRGLLKVQNEADEEAEEDEAELKEIEENVPAEEKAALEAKAEEKADEAVSAGPMSIAERMRILSGREFDEEDVADAAEDEAEEEAEKPEE